MAFTPKLTYKGKPLVRKDNELYYGNMTDPYVLYLQITTTKPVGDQQVADKVHLMLLSTDTTKAPQDYTQARFSPDCWLFFGKETAGLPEAFRAAHYDRCLRLPMRAEARSLNLSNSVAILIYEALRQTGFPGLCGTGEMAEEHNNTTL